jgi:hypothetical protein
MLDMWLHEHVEHLYRLIREKAMVQYFSPFISVNLVAMAQAFNCELPQLEKELAKLINDNSISARIDSHNKVSLEVLSFFKIQTFFSLISSCSACTPDKLTNVLPPLKRQCQLERSMRQTQKHCC